MAVCVREDVLSACACVCLAVAAHTTWVWAVWHSLQEAVAIWARQGSGFAYVLLVL
jgi:hypothetical protein